MAHFHVKTKNGRPYLYVREIARVGGRPKVVKQTYIGSPARVAALVSGENSEETELRTVEFGSLWLARELDRDVGFAEIVDSVIPRGARETGPSIGEYFLYAVFNRMIEAQSKLQLSSWYEDLAVHEVRPVDVKELTSRRYWEKWDRVNESMLEEISRRFFARICDLERIEADCVLFDTTNYYTFMASDTDSELARRGHNKDGRHNLRQVGLGLLVERGSRLPLFYRAYPGNLHDSKLFGEVMDEMIGVVSALDREKGRITVVVDKGMNGDENIAWIDDRREVHFVTTYSLYHTPELAGVSLERFEPVENEKNRLLSSEGEDTERLLAWRTSGEYWGKERTVVVTFNPAKARKQDYTLESKLDVVRDELLKMRTAVREDRPQWRDPETIRVRYRQLCEKIHLPQNLYTIECTTEDGTLSMGFRKDPYQIDKVLRSHGRNVIVTDNRDWTTAEIIRASTDRWEIESNFRLTKDDDLVAVQPIRHWTDSKIRCHLLTCVVALTYLRRLERKLKANGSDATAEKIIAKMRKLHSVLSWKKGERQPRRRLTTPTKTQAEVLRAFGSRIDRSGVLQPL